MATSSLAIDDGGSPPAPLGLEPVSVIIPVYNAAAFIDRTLASVRSQTHRALEIIIVDDGSTDDSADRIRMHAERDERIVFLQQANHGVAAARNAALELASSDYVAPIDADDLWAVDKIERQLASARRHRPEAGLVFGWYVVINERDRIISHQDSVHPRSDLIRQMARNNIVGSGSAPLMLRSAVIEAGGYDTSLRDQRAEGCEDYKLYFQIMERYPTVVIPEYLTGYRVYGASMSGDMHQMIRSRSIVTAEMERRRPDLLPALRAGKVRAMRFLFSRAVRSGRYREAAEIFSGMFAHDKRASLHEISALCVAGGRALHRQLGKRVGRYPRKFPIGDPDEGVLQEKP